MAEMVRCEAGVALCGAEFAEPPKRDLREEFRILLRRSGWLSSGDTWVPCIIENVSAQGFLIMSNTTFPAGTIVGLKCELFPKRFLRCGIQVVHITDTCMGAKIVEMNGYALYLFREFFEDYYAKVAAAKIPLISDDSDSDEQPSKHP